LRTKQGLSICQVNVKREYNSEAKDLRWIALRFAQQHCYTRGLVTEGRKQKKRHSPAAVKPGTPAKQRWAPTDRPARTDREPQPPQPAREGDTNETLVRKSLHATAKKGGGGDGVPGGGRRIGGPQVLLPAAALAAAGASPPAAPRRSVGQAMVRPWLLSLSLFLRRREFPFPLTGIHLS